MKDQYTYNADLNPSLIFKIVVLKKKKIFIYEKSFVPKKNAFILWPITINTLYIREKGEGLRHRNPTNR